LESALIGVLGMVFEIIPAILGPLHLISHPKSRPFTPCAVVLPVYGVLLAPGAGDHEDVCTQERARTFMITPEVTRGGVHPW
jgi:hypothetical protein